MACVVSAVTYLANLMLQILNDACTLQYLFASKSSSEDQEHLHAFLHVTHAFSRFNCFFSWKKIDINMRWSVLCGDWTPNVIVALWPEPLGTASCSTSELNNELVKLNTLLHFFHILDFINCSGSFLRFFEYLLCGGFITSGFFPGLIPRHERSNSPNLYMEETRGPCPQLPSGAGGLIQLTSGWWVLVCFLINNLFGGYSLLVHLINNFMTLTFIFGRP